MEREYLKEILENKNINQHKLAVILGTSDSLVSMVVKGKRRMSLKALFVMAKGLAIDPNKLFWKEVDFAKKKGWLKI